MGCKAKIMAGLEKGFSMVESMISMFIFLLIVLFSLDCFIVTKKHFNQLQQSETSNTAAYAALDRMRRDIIEAGKGLKEPMALGILEGISTNQNELVILSQQEKLSVLEDIVSGQQRVPADNTRNLKIKQQICIFGSGNGEVHSIVSVTQDSILLDSPVASQYLQEETSLVLLRRLSLFFDESTQIIRRKVNNSPSQPLLEGVASFRFEYFKDSNLVRLHLCLNMEEEKDYETTVFPKNTALPVTK
jgi:competence protein ComGF